MLRSLVATSLDNLDQEGVIRRNLSMDTLAGMLGEVPAMWIDVIDPAEKEIRWLESTFDLHPSVVDDLLRKDTRPSMMTYAKHIFISLFQPQFKAGRIESREIHCIVGTNYFITVREESATAVDNAYKRVALTPDTWHNGVAYFLFLTAQQVIDAYYPMLDKISMQLNEIETALLAGEANNKMRKPVYAIKRQLIILRQMIAPQREAISSTVGEERLTAQSDTRELFRHLYERLLRVYDVIDSQRDLSSNVLDMMEGFEQRHMVQAVNWLTILSMIFLPLTFFTGFFQLGFATTSDPVVLPITGTAMLVVIGGLMLLSAFAMIIIFKKKGWM